jgi:hypothetical protein
MLIKPDIELDLDEEEYFIHETKIRGFDGEEYRYNYAITLEKRAFTYIKNNYCVPYQNEDYNFINQYQFDICGQKLCRFINDPQKELCEKDSMHIKQEIIHDIGFVNYEGIRFIKYSEIHEYFLDKFDYDGRFYLYQNRLYIKHQQNWYGPFQIKNPRYDQQLIDEGKIDPDTKLPVQLNEMVCGIDIVYTRTNVYVKTQNNIWKEVYFEYCRTDNKKVNEITKIGKDIVCINAIITDKNLPYWSYYLNLKNINQTLRIFRDFKYRIENKDNNDFTSGFLNKQTITDLMWIYVFYVCKYPIEKLKICDESESEIESISV